MQKLISYLKNQDQVIVFSVGVALLTAVIISLVFMIFYNTLPPKLPLFYSLFWGENQLVSKTQFLILPGILILIALVNTFLSYQLHHAHLALKRTVAASLVLLSIIFLITAIKILIIFI